MSNSDYKTPKRLSGFNDFFGSDMRLRQYVIDTFKATFEKYGYEPLETPALEYSELILGQSGEEAEKQYYRFLDNGGRDVMLKFEVMIAMCRALAQNINNVSLPYKRYQIQRVWRAEKVQKGRYREFTQCDADTIGSNSMVADAEFIQMGLEIVANLGFKEYQARVSNRKFLEGLAEYLGIEKELFYGFSMSIDKLEKIGAENVITEMTEKRKIDVDKAKQAIEMISPEKYEGVSFLKVIESFQETVGTTNIGNEGLQELKEIAEYLGTVGINNDLYKFDTSIARGLASYTGPVWEFNIVEGNVGSIAGCGRYDRAIGKYIGREVPATGGSFGIERITDIMKDREMITISETPAQILVTVFDEQLLSESVTIAKQLRDNNISTILYPGIVKLDKQLKYADKKGIPFVVIVGPDEANNKTITVKDMQANKQEESTVEKLVKKIK